MWNLLQLAAALALPLLVLAALLWVLMYSSLRLALRHEVTRLEREEQQARTAKARAQQGNSKTRPASIQGDGQTRPRPAPDRTGAQPGRQPLARRRRAAS